MRVSETSSLRNLEGSDDAARQIDETGALYRTNLPVALVGEVVVPFAAFWGLSGTEDPVRAFELGTAVLVALLFW